MRQILKPIMISLSPNVESDDIWLAFKLIFRPWQWKKGKKIKKIEDKFKDYLKVKYAFSFNSGRSALLAILSSLNIKKGDEIIIQAFTCNAVINPILSLGAKPIFVDIDEKININPKKIEEKITSQTKAIIIQHTFGWPAEIKEIIKIAQENNLYLIEDVAHSLGAEYNREKIGTFGDVAFFSFGRDKIISSVFGGMAVSNNEKIGEKIRVFQRNIPQPSNFWILQQLLHPVLVNYFVLPAYKIHPDFGKIVLGGLQKIFVLSKAVSKKEKNGQLGKNFPKKMPNSLASLAINQFQKLEKLNNHRREIAHLYGEQLKNILKIPLVEEKELTPVFMRFPVLISNGETDKILKEARKKRIYLNDGWRKSPIVPPDTKIEKIGYKKGTCPRAEKLAKEIINLPTHINISKKEAEKLIEFLINQSQN